MVSKGDEIGECSEEKKVCAFVQIYENLENSIITQTMLKVLGMDHSK